MVNIKKNSIVDDFVINDEVLGIGVSGKVLTCTNKDNQKKYALKCLEATPISMREIDLHWRATQGCKYIVNIHSVYENQIGGQKQFLMVMEYMEGGELFGKITKRTKPFTENEVAKIMFQICSAVQHLHSMNIAHRDLKPENLLLTSNDENALIKLIDFGFAKEVISGLQTPCYTPYYVAPEIFDKQKYDQSCDIWSLGVIMYILCSGYPPFFSSNGEPISPGMKRRIRSGQYGFPESEWSTVSNEAKELITGMLKTDPKQRFTITDVMRSKWISNFLEVPNTPLPSLNIIREDEDGWKEVQQHTVRAIDEMRKNYEQEHIIQSQIEKRKNKINSENTSPLNKNIDHNNNVIDNDHDVNDKNEKSFTA